MDVIIWLVVEGVAWAVYWLVQLLFWLPGYLILRMFADDDQIAQMSWLGILLSVLFWIALALVVVLAVK